MWITDHRGAAVPGHVMGYDQESGLGLVQTLQAARRTGHRTRGERGVRRRRIRSSSPDTAASMNSSPGRIIAKREFAGYWEYVLDEALFTAPAHPNWGGAALVGHDGRLLGVGSLLVQTVSSSGEQSGANMIVPIDLLKPILDDMKSYGRPNRPARPWLGFLVQDIGDHLVVASVYDGCPADRARGRGRGLGRRGRRGADRRARGAVPQGLVHRPGRERDPSHHRPGRRPRARSCWNRSTGTRASRTAPSIDRSGTDQNPGDSSFMD